MDDSKGGSGGGSDDDEKRYRNLCKQAVPIATELQQQQAMMRCLTKEEEKNKRISPTYSRIYSVSLCVCACVSVSFR